MDIIRTVAPGGFRSSCALGYFDGVHLGHAAVIGAAVTNARACGIKSGVLSFDMSKKRAAGKGRGDITTISSREHEISRLGADVLLIPDFCEISSLSGEQFVSDLLRDCLGAETVFCGDDFRFGRDRACGINELRELCSRLGISVMAVPKVYVDNKEVSSTRIKQLLEIGDMESVARLLGRPYSLSLPVYEEKHLARRLGFPTINQKFPEGLAVPRFGVYRSEANVSGTLYRSVSNFGIRPTVDDSERVTLETHIIGFSGNLYGKTIDVGFISFIRGERKFESPDQLKAQVLSDIEAASAD